MTHCHVKLQRFDASICEKSSWNEILVLYLGMELRLPHAC